MRGRLWLISVLVVLMLSSAYTAEAYIQDVLAGRQVTGQLVRQAVQRHVEDLKRVGSPEFPYHFDEVQARRVIDFKQQLRHIKGEWANPRQHDTRIRLEPWQQFKDWVLFGWRRADGTRRFRKSYVEVARKNGKTTDAAATAVYVYMADRPQEMGSEIYCVATKKDQAKIAWTDAKLMIERHPVLSSRTRTYKQNSTVIRHDDPAAVLTIWGKDSDTQDGFNPAFVVVDEAHAYPDNSMIEVIESGMGSRQQPLIYIITTAGLDIRSSVYQEERALAIQVLERSLDPVPEDFFALIYTLDEGDDWTDPAVWIKANPNLGVSVSHEYIEARIQQGLQMPSRQNKIKTKNLNIWTQSETRWIGDEQWMRCDGKVNGEELEGRPCYVGLDLSASQDITAYALVFPPQETGEQYKILWRYFIPGDLVVEKERTDKVPYTYWAEKKIVQTTPGDVIDYDHIEQALIEDAARYEFQEIAYDPWKAQEIVNHLTEGGFTMVPIYQRYSGMAVPTDTFEKKVFAREIAHGGDPVARWMMSCAEVKSDRQGNIMPMKPARDKTGKRIDGIVAAIMGLGRAVVHENDDEEFRGIIAL